MNALKSNGINVKSVSRGLDHGVWASFKVAFAPDENPLNVPLVQASLFSSEDPNQHYSLGRAVASLREENIAIIVSGMAVHNLRDLRFTLGNPKPMPYTSSFDEALKDAANSAPAEREQKMADLLERPDARQAHPTFEHLLPIFVGAGAAGDDVGKRMWTLKEGSMSWAQYRFGEVAAN
jgi:4,5-DOPA dioxygenase extradiol